jgi:hypothetical protein
MSPLYTLWATINDYLRPLEGNNLNRATFATDILLENNDIDP